MTKMKKLTSVLLAVVMAMGLAVPAWASMDFSEEDDIVVNLMEDNSYEAEDKLSVIGESGSKIIVVDREIAETMGKEILSYIDEEMMVFFANMTNAEVEQYTEVPRYLRAEDEPGDVLGTGLLLTNGKYNYVTYYKGNVDRNALAQSDMISMGEYDNIAEIAYNFAREKTAVCENTEARTKVGLEQADEIFADEAALERASGALKTLAAFGPSKEELDAAVRARRDAVRSRRLAAVRISNASVADDFADAVVYRLPMLDETQQDEMVSAFLAEVTADHVRVRWPPGR